MDDNNLIVLSLDLSKTKARFDVGLEKICDNISSTQTAKIALSLNISKTQTNLQRQLNTVLKGLNTQGSNAFSGVAESANKAQKPIDGIAKGFTATGTAAQAAGSKLNNSFAGSLAYSTTKMLGMMAVLKTVQIAIGSVKDMINNVIELDRSLTELNKVCDFTSNGLEKFTEKAYEAAEEVGRTGREVIEAATEFKKAGYDIESSLNLSKVALMMTNVGDGIRNVEEASSSMISVLRGFNISDADALKVLDKINEVSNNSPIAFEDITDGLRRVSGTMRQAGNSIDETIGMLVGGFSQLRNIEMVSSGLVMISQRLRGIGEDGEAVEGLAPKIASEFKSIANIDIEDGNGGLRSTYEILEDMARVFPTLTEKQQQYLGELAAGNRQVKVLNAILQQWQDVDNAITQSENSLGSATKENEIYKNSIAAIRKELESTFQDLSQTVVDSDWIKAPLKALTEFIKFLTDALENPLVQSLITGSLIMAVPKIFSCLKGIGSFISDYKAMIQMIVRGNDTVAASNAKVGKSFGGLCNKGLIINMPTYLEAA